MNAPEASVFPGHSSFAWATAVAAFALGGPVGAGFGGFVANIRGRRIALAVDAILFIIGGLIQACAASITHLTLGRFIVGAASGFSSVLVPVYLGEIAPPVLRGAFGAVSQMGLVSGILAADLVALVPMTWRFVFGVSPFIAVFQLLAVPFVVESPRWLLDKQGPGSMEARSALRRLHTFLRGDDHLLETEISHIVEANDVHKTQEHSETSLDAHDVHTLIEFLSDDRVRPALLTCIFYHVAQQLCGINAVFYYSTMFFQNYIANPLLATTFIAVVNVLAVYVAILLMDHLGRKPLLAVSSGGMLLCVLVLTCALLNLWCFTPLVGLLAVAAYVAFFEIGLGPIAWLIVAEIFESHTVDAAQALACQVNWLSNFLIGLIFPSMNALLGPWSFAPFALVLLVTFLFTLLRLPETKDHSPLEIQCALAGVSPSVVPHSPILSPTTTAEK